MPLVFIIDYFIYSFPNRNLKCGSMFCGGGGESITGKRADYTVLGIECKLAVDDDKTRNINMVPNGARCGPNKVKLSSLTLNTGLSSCLIGPKISVFRFVLITDAWTYQFTG